MLLIAGLALPQFVLVIDGFVFLWFTPAALLVLGYKSLALRSTGYSVLALFAALNLLVHLIGRVCIA